MASEAEAAPRSKWPSLFRRTPTDQESEEEKRSGPAKWSLGVLNDTMTLEVPGSVLLLASDRNEPLGLRNAPARTSHSSIPTGILRDLNVPVEHERDEKDEKDEKKKTKDGKIILEPQPEESENDPLNWPAWRRDAALLSLGLYCMVGGGLTPILAAGFTNVAEDYAIGVEHVSLTTGLYMLGMGLGSVVASPTAILYGKRPVYLFSSILLIVCSVWCALSPNFPSLIVARIFQGAAVSPVECLPSATIAEIFFLHERAYRIGIYTLLLLGGKNLVPLVSAAVIQRLGWRWVFWIVGLVVAFCGSLLFLFVPETFWDRAPIPKSRRPSGRPSFLRRLSSKHGVPRLSLFSSHPHTPAPPTEPTTPAAVHPRGRNAHVEFAPVFDAEHKSDGDVAPPPVSNLVSPPATIEDLVSPLNHSGHDSAHRVGFATTARDDPDKTDEPAKDARTPQPVESTETSQALDTGQSSRHLQGLAPIAIEDHSEAPDIEQASPSPNDYFGSVASDPPVKDASTRDTDSERQSISLRSILPGGHTYTRALRDRPAQTFVQQLKPYHGRLNRDKWLKVMVRPFILFSYPSVLWSAAVYACSVGWLIVISESIAVIYRDHNSYNFNAMQTGLVYISPFVGGILGTAVAGKVSDIIVKAMAARNGGLYEPEFRLVMALPITITTVIGLMGFGWSAQARDAWIVPTVFFGIVSFGCSLGSTTSITFCVDSYRQYAGEALVTLNFSKNIFHGLVFSLFVTGWITTDGPKTVYIWIGIIQLILMMASVPMYIYGKRARMWTVRKNFMEKF